MLLMSLSIFIQDCSNKSASANYIFQTLDSKRTGLNFSNDLHYNNDLNLFKYIYFYNGSGVAAGDFNNDGKIDLFFGSNQKQNTLYLNKGNLSFSDVTAKANIPNDTGWTTGISVIDINNDGLLDIYICRVGNYRTLKSKNQLLINQGVDKEGVPHFLDKAKEYGLDFSGFSTQAVFFDYDMDGDLDMFLLTHSVHENGTFRPRKDFDTVSLATSGQKIFRNDGNKFIDVTNKTGIKSNPLGYGLGICVSDINLDGYPDIYIGNDFHENDYLYINQKDGTFKEVGTDQLMHTSQFSMGVDVADANNDAFPEIISMDMLPSDPYILKRSLGEDTYDVFNFKINSGYSYQYTRNNLQYNRKSGVFSEIGLYSGVAATDWSWAPLWMDFNNDGLKDLFISNGIPKRMNDIDYINFISDGAIQKKIRDNNIEDNDLSLINNFPEIKLPNKFFLNNGSLSFTDQEDLIAENPKTFSNGAIYADLDNDGDLDIVVNNIDGPAILYQNNVASKSTNSSLSITLKGTLKNVKAIGSKIIVYVGKEIRTYEKYPVHGFMSSMEGPLIIGTLGSSLDSIKVIWPDNTFENIKDYKAKKSITLNYKLGLPIFNYSSLKLSTNPTEKAFDITKTTGINYVHEENRFSEFDREPLIPHMLSTEGPAVAVADINGDGLDDIYIGGSRDKRSEIFIQNKDGKFSRKNQLALGLDSTYENIDACWVDVNMDGFLDLAVASGGNEFYAAGDLHNSPRIYINDGKGNLSKMPNAFQNISLTASCIVASDFNGDGFPDLFIGARAVPWEYGQIPSSYLFVNDGKGHFINVTKEIAPELVNVGFVTNAIWYDLNKDGRKDLLVSLEWGGIVAFLNNNGKFTKKILTDKNGFWNFILPVDINNDGNIDLVVGNLGLNSRLKASSEFPIKLYYNDFDNNGKNEQVLTYYLNKKEIPFANKAELEKQIPMLKKKFLYAADFAKASLEDLFGSDKLKKSKQFFVDYLQNAILINKGNMSFDLKSLPWEAQLSSLRDAAIINVKDDPYPEILLMGNYYENNIEMGRYDADFGSILKNEGNNIFKVFPLNGLNVKGQVRHIKPIRIRNEKAFLVLKNNDSLKVLKFAP